MKKIIAITALAMAAGDLPAVKMCVPGHGEWASSPTTTGYDIDGNVGGAYGGWANGIGCGNTSNKSGALSSYCQTTYIAGIAACAKNIQPNGDYLLSADSSSENNKCMCLRTYPTKQYKYWLLMGSPGTGSIAECNSACADHCAQYRTALLSLY